ncbi:MAG: tRNA-(ms[2]io[6]A)-hydroxylase [Natronospirillum sp.]
MSDLDNLVQPIRVFVGAPTPQAWIEWALDNQALMLIDHAHCEKKAASTALSMMYRYLEYPAFLNRLSKLAREELVHFEQVLKILKQRHIVYDHLTAAPYAGELLKVARQEEPGKLIDRLIIGAFIEARSCERFAAVAPHLDADLQAFYLGLLRSEARHFEVYLEQAATVVSARLGYGRSMAETAVAERADIIRQRENALIQAPATEFRFHSGVPIEAISES